MTTTELAPPSATAEVGALNMIRADLDIREFHRWAGSRGFIGRSAFDEGFAMHCLLKESFGELAPKPFRVITPRDQKRRTGALYGYARCTAEALRKAAAAYACPLQSRILPIEGIDSKRIPTAWRVGQRLGFEVLVRPVKRLSRCVKVRNGKSRDERKNCENGCDRKGCSIERGEVVCKKGCKERHHILERDAFQAEAELHAKGGMKRTREDVYQDWLRKRLEANGGALLEEATLGMFQRTRAVRKLHARASEGPHAIMYGNLTITDTALFNCMLAQGIGRHKAYGYGMLLLRPVRA